MNNLKQVHIGWYSRFRVWLQRVFFKRLMALMSRMPEEKIAGIQVKAAAGLKDSYSGLPQKYLIINGVPGNQIRDLGECGKSVILYLHGGGFLFPASPKLQVALLGRLCRDLDASGFLPDYRLAPQNPAPAALDDCESAYRGLLAMGIKPENIVLIGDSAGGNLVLALLHRLNKKNLDLPSCGVCLSPITELARVHGPPARTRNASSEAFVPVSQADRSNRWYTGELDPTDPEISPLYADYRGFPPLYFVAAETEMLLDDSVLAAQRARESGVDTKIDIWPVLPHAFLIFEHIFVEAVQARGDVVEFVRSHVK